jgi:hypothetical protein
MATIEVAIFDPKPNRAKGDQQMSTKKGKAYSEKHSSNLRPDPLIEEEMRKRAATQRIPCAAAFEISRDLGKTTMAVGQTADLLNIAVVECQLGLFGYQPKKKIIKAEDTSNQELKEAIIGSAENNRLSCKKAWQIAAQFNINTLAVGNISQANGIQIKTCQLGAF